MRVLSSGLIIPLILHFHRPKIFLSVQNAAIQVMTIHKSKGLEFDHVIIPGLAKQAPANAHQLLLWMQRQREGSSGDLIMAPIKAV